MSKITIICVLAVLFGLSPINTLLAANVNYTPLDIKKTPQGFTVNGKQYIDPQAPIKFASLISHTGFVGYAIESTMGEYLVRFVQPLKNSNPMDFGKISKNADTWIYTDTEGKSYQGDGFLLLSYGVLLKRGTTVGIYFTPDKKPQTIVLPAGYTFSAVQKGDLCFSKLLLIEKPLPPKKKFGISFSSKGVKDYDFALVNVDNGELVETFQMRIREKTPQAKLRYIDNTYHLIDRPQGPLVLTLEDGYQRIVARDISRKKKVILFERKHGISQFTTKIKNGKITVTAGLGFRNKTIEDVESFIDKAN